MMAGKMAPGQSQTPEHEQGVGHEMGGLAGLPGLPPDHNSSQPVTPTTLCTSAPPTSPNASIPL